MKEIKSTGNRHWECRGMSTGICGLHFQIFCDDDNLRKITGRTTPEMDVSRHGRTDVVYGDIYFYLPPGTRFYRSAPENNAVDNTGEVFRARNRWLSPCVLILAIVS